MEFAMNGGDGTYSYSKNSRYQRHGANFVKGEIEEEIHKNLDVETLSSASNTIRLADLGCSTGPNTFISMQNILEAIKRKHFSQNPNNSRSLPEFQVFFNDRISNDFNTLFTSLPPEKQYFAAGVAGSFHGRLFPESSLHLVYTCHALHWLSRIPEEVLDKNSPAWNKGRIHYINAPREVYDAYRSQFNKDMEVFLDARSKEIVEGGMMVIIMTGLPDGVDPRLHTSTFTQNSNLMASTLMDMAKEGLMSEALVGSFNIPIYRATRDEISGLIAKNGCFSVLKIEFVKPVVRDVIGDYASVVIKHVRAVFEGMLTNHFGVEITNEMFIRFHETFSRDNDIQLTTSLRKERGQLFIVLKRT